MTIEAVQADRERIRAITSLPEAASQLRAALTMALTGVTVDEAKTALSLRSGALSPDEVAASINKQFGAR